MEHKYFFKKLNKPEFNKLICKFNKLDFNIESNVKYFLKKVRNFAFNNKCFFKHLMKFKDSCKFKLSKNEECKIQKALEPFLNFMKNQQIKNFNKFNKYIKKDPEFQRKDSLFKAEGGQTKENYDNLISYFEGKLPWLRKKIGKNSIFMIADDNCVPMFRSDLGDFNNFGNYHAGLIKFETKESYESLTFAFQNGYSEKGQVVFERLGVMGGLLITVIASGVFTFSSGVYLQYILENLSEFSLGLEISAGAVFLIAVIIFIIAIIIYFAEIS